MINKGIPKISIITPSYNQGEFIEDTILSILDQGYPNLEYIIIDGASTDKSVEVIKKYEKHLVYWVSEPDNGQSHAINKGLRMATGDIVAWLNSDDTFLPQTLHKVVGYFEENPCVSLIHGQSTLFNQKGWEVTRGANKQELPYQYFAGMAFPQPSSFFKRQVIEQYGVLHENLHYGMDYDLYVRIALNEELLAVDDVFSKYLIHSESKTSQHHLRFAKDWAKVFSKVLRTMDCSQVLISELKKLGLYDDGNDLYPTNKTFDESFIKKVISNFLLFQIQYFYQGLDLEKTHTACKYLKKFDPIFFNKHNLGALSIRLKLPFGKTLIRTYRYLTS